MSGLEPSEAWTGGLWRLIHSLDRVEHRGFVAASTALGKHYGKA